ncbi:MAG: Crp/Fnr family transcriptional regulator [Muribaculaceae bacterium]|nr:Crp/Fnr family transcriptional regulator [Muribaculaceae bacterium]
MKTNKDKDNEGSIFTILRELPLIKGVSQTRLQHIAGHVPLHFIKYAAGDVIADAGQECTHLKFIVSGSVRVEIVAANGRFSVAQTLAGPNVLAPDYLFGRTNRYPGTATAVGPVGVMQITKDVYRSMLAEDPVFMFNYLNVLSTAAQKGQAALAEAASGSVEQKIACWVQGMTQPGSTDIVMCSHGRDMNTLLGVAKASYMAVIERLKAQRIVEADSLRTIKIISRQELLDSLTAYSGN